MGYGLQFPIKNHYANLIPSISPFKCSSCHLIHPARNARSTIAETLSRQPLDAFIGNRQHAINKKFLIGQGYGRRTNNPKNPTRRMRHGTIT